MVWISNNSLYYLEYGNEYNPEGKQRRVRNFSGVAIQTDDEPSSSLLKIYPTKNSTKPNQTFGAQGKDESSIVNNEPIL